MTLWEYNVVVLPFDSGFSTDKIVDAQAIDQELNRLGREGWELVSTSISTTRGYSRELIAIFKRPRQNL